MCWKGCNPDHYLEFKHKTEIKNNHTLRLAGGLKPEIHVADEHVHCVLTLLPLQSVELRQDSVSQGNIVSHSSSRTATGKTNKTVYVLLMS